jgi:hypothetical protein
MIFFKREEFVDDFILVNDTITKINDKVINLVVPDGVKSISSNAFFNAKEISILDISNSNSLDLNSFKCDYKFKLSKFKGNTNNIILPDEFF